jgi:hypothetical protein
VNAAVFVVLTASQHLHVDARSIMESWILFGSIATSDGSICSYRAPLMMAIPEIPGRPFCYYSLYLKN